MPSPEFELATIEVEKVNGVVNSNDDLLEVITCTATLSSHPRSSITVMGNCVLLTDWPNL